jgi:hypothetical protein
MLSRNEQATVGRAAWLEEGSRGSVRPQNELCFGSGMEDAALLLGKSTELAHFSPCPSGSHCLPGRTLGLFVLFAEKLLEHGREVWERAEGNRVKEGCSHVERWQLSHWPSADT